MLPSNRIFEPSLVARMRGLPIPRVERERAVREAERADRWIAGMVAWVAVGRAVAGWLRGKTRAAAARNGLRLGSAR